MNQDDAPLSLSLSTTGYILFYLLVVAIPNKFQHTNGMCIPHLHTTTDIPETCYCVREQT